MSERPDHYPPKREHHQHLPGHHDLATGAEHRIMHALHGDHRGAEHLDHVFKELHDLKSGETAAGFKKDLAKINSDLNKKGFLPHLQLVEDPHARQGFSAKPQGDRSLENDRSHGDVRSPEAAPRDSLEAVQHPERRQSDDHRPHHVDHGGDHHHHRRPHHGHHRHGRHHRDGHHPGPGGENRGRHHSFEGGAYDGVKAPDEATLGNSVKTVMAEAKAQGLSPNATKAALASMLAESQGNPQARGDGNTSFGLFQLHRGGELTDALRSGKLANESEAFDPQKNAHVALAYFKRHQNAISDPGRLAAAAQRPKYRAEYAAKVDSILHSGQVDQLMKKYGDS